MRAVTTVGLHLHEWMPVGPPLRLSDGNRVTIEACACFAMRGTIGDEHYVVEPNGVPNAMTAAAAGALIGGWAAGVFRRRSLS